MSGPAVARAVTEALLDRLAAASMRIVELQNDRARSFQEALVAKTVAQEARDAAECAQMAIAQLTEQRDEARDEAEVSDERTVAAISEAETFRAERDLARAANADLVAARNAAETERDEALRDIGRTGAGLVVWLPPADVPEPEGPCAVVTWDGTFTRSARRMADGPEWLAVGSSGAWAWEDIIDGADLVAVIRPPDPEPVIDEHVCDDWCQVCEETP